MKNNHNWYLCDTHNYNKYFGSAFTMFVGITFPFFGALLGFFGGFAFAPTTYFVSPLNYIFVYIRIGVYVISFNVIITLFCSFPALCGFLFTNQRGSACPGSPIGYVLYASFIFYVFKYNL